MRGQRAGLMLPGLLRVSLLLLAVALLFVPAGLRTGIYLKVEVAAGLATLLSLLFVRPSRNTALKIAVAGLLAGDILNTSRYLLPDFTETQLAIMAVAYLLYTLAAAFLLLGVYHDRGPLEKTETGVLLGLSVCFAALQINYVFVPASAIYRFPYYFEVLVTLHTLVESLVLALAVLLGMRARSRYWFYLLNGFTLLPLSAFALGYEITAEKGVPFSDYGWVLGLFFLLAAQTYPEPGEEKFARWDSVRVRLVWFVCSVAALLLLLLYALQAFAVRDILSLTSFLFFLLYGVWLVANLIAVRVSEDIRSLLTSVESPGAGGRSRFSLALHETDQFAEKLRAAYDTIREQAGLAALSRLSAQVAHDIRSPLAALDSALRDLPQLPEDKRLLITGATGRIRDIAEDLLEKNRGGAAPGERAAGACALAGLIEQVVAEKLLQLHDRPGVELAAELPPGAGSLFARVGPAQFSRVLSNLINNAVEALEGGGRVTVSLEAGAGGVSVKVSDTGRGIPPELLPKLGRRGETHGKAGGSGLGLAHARAAAEAWGGTLGLSSEPGKGTVAALLLPLLPPAAPAGRRALLIDDDPLVRLNWKTAAAAAGVELGVYEKPADFLAAASALPAETPLFMDSELGAGAAGEELAEELRLKGFTSITLATGHPPERFANRPWLKISGKEPPWPPRPGG